MSQNLLSFLQGQLSDDAIAQLSTYLGETTTEAGAATAAGLQAILAAMTQKAATPHGAADLVAMVTRVTGDGSLSQLAGMLVAGTSLADVARHGAPLAAALLGHRQAGVVDWLASTSGVGRGSAGSLLAMLTPLALSGLSKYLTSTGDGVNASSIADVLDAQSAPTLAALPATLAAALGVPSRHVTSPSGATRARRVDDVKDSGLSFLTWVLPLLAIAALLAYVWYR